MKKITLVLVVMIFAITACGGTPTAPKAPTAQLYGGHTRADCALNWQSLEVEAGDEAWMVNFILNTKHAPDTVGYALEECINGGWTGWR